MENIEQKSAILQFDSSPEKDTMKVFRQLIERKYLDRPLDFYQGQQFIQESRRIELAISIEFNSLVLNLISLQLRNIGSKFTDIYRLIKIILDYVTERATYFYDKYQKERERTIQTNSNNFCRGCGNSLVIQKLKWQNKMITYISLGSLKPIGEIQESQINTDTDTQQSYQQKRDLQDGIKGYILSLKVSQAVPKLNEILQTTSRKQYSRISSELKHDLFEQTEQQRRRVVGMVENKKSAVRWSIPKVIGNKIQKQDKKVGTNTWQFDHIQQTLKIQKQAVSRTLLLERQKSQQYLNSLRKSRSLIQEQQIQIQNLKEQINMFLIQRQKSQKVVQDFQKLHEKYQQLQTFYEDTKIQKNNLKKQMIHQNVMFDTLKNDYDELRITAKGFDKEVQTDPKVVIQKIIVSKTRKEKLLYKSAIQSVRQKLDKNLSLQVSMSKSKKIGSHNDYNEPSIKIPKQSSFIKQNNNKQNEPTIEQSNVTNNQTNINEQYSESKHIITTKQLKREKGKRFNNVNFGRKKMIKTISTENRQQQVSVTRRSPVLKSIHKKVIKSQQHSLHRTPQKTSTSTYNQRPKIIRNTTSPFELKKSQQPNNISIQLKKNYPNTSFNCFLQSIETQFQKENSKEKQIHKQKYQVQIQQQSKPTTSLKKNRLKLDIRSIGKYKPLKQKTQITQNIYLPTMSNTKRVQIDTLITLIKDYESFQKKHFSKLSFVNSWLSDIYFPDKQTRLTSIDYITSIIRLYFDHQKCQYIQNKDLSCKHIQELKKLVSGKINENTI